MEFYPTKKITVSVDKKISKSSNLYLIYDNNFKTQLSFNRPENHFIKILIVFSFSSDGQYIIGDFGIPEHSFPGITGSYFFYLYACFLSTDSTRNSINSQSFQKMVHSEVYKLALAEDAHVKLPVVPYFCDKDKVNDFSQIPVECIFSIIPFVFPYFKPKLRLLPMMLFSFVNLIPQITLYHSNWPLISWFRQMQYTNDASVYDLYNILFPDKEIDLSVIIQGLKVQKKTQKDYNIQNDPNLITSILYYSPPITDASIDEPGLTHSQIKKIALKLANLISLELGYSYHVFSIEPQYDFQIQENPELLIFCPSFEIRRTILPEIICNGNIYTLHSVVREEEGNITSSVYSPFTKILYDFRNGQTFPLNRQIPPICNVNEQYLMLLYVHQDVNNFLSQKVQPISPFYPRYPIVDVYECKLGEKMPTTSQKADSFNLDFDKKHVYFLYDQNTMPFPSIPLEEVCGKSVLQFDIKDFQKPAVVIWQAKREETIGVNPCNIFFVPVTYSIGDGYDIIDDNPDLTFAVVQDHYIVAFFNSENDESFDHEKIKKSFPLNNTVCFHREVLEYANDGTCSKYLSIAFTKNKKSDTYINFVGTPLLFLIDHARHYDSIINDLKSLYDFDHVYIKQKSVWAEVTKSDDFSDAADNAKYIDLLIQLK